MIRFTYQLLDDLDPKDLHRKFLEAGSRPRLYSYKPLLNQWTLCSADSVEAEVIREVLAGLRTHFDEKVVASRFAK